MQTNFCASKKQMCECTASNYKDCKFHAKATVADRCMYRSISLGEKKFHCDNVDAQYDCRGDLSSCLEMIEEGKEGDVPT